MLAAHQSSWWSSADVGLMEWWPDRNGKEKTSVYQTMQHGDLSQKQRWLRDIIHKVL